MKKWSQIIFWSLLLLSIIILILNVGIALILFGILILVALIIHVIVGYRLRKFNNPLLIISSINLFLFALVRPDGGHIISANGLSRICELFGGFYGFNSDYLNFYYFATIFLFISQISLDLYLLKWSKYQK